MAYSPEQWERAKAYYEAGTHSLSQIQDIIGISKSKISEKAKKELWERGRNSDYIEAKVIIAEKKGNEKRNTLEVLDNIADDAIRNRNLVFNVTQKALRKANLMIDEIDNANDLKAIIDLSDKASITLGVNARHATSVINNTNALQTNETKTIVFQRLDSVRDS